MGRGTRFEHVERILKENGADGCRALEIGCGGSVYRDLFASYVGIDLLTNSYEEGGGVSLYCNGQQMGFKDKSFDLVFTVACLYQIPDTEKVLSEVRRILKDNGKLIIFDYNAVTTKRLRDRKNGGCSKYQVWSPFELARKVKKGGFNTAINYDYLREIPDRSKILLRTLFSAKILCLLAFPLLQLREGWNIVIAKKV